MIRRRIAFLGFMVVIAAALVYVLTTTRSGRELRDAIRIGSILILSGQYASYGEQFRDGATLGIARANEDSAARPVEIRFFDSGGLKEKARELLLTMHDRDSIKYVADVMGSALTLDAAPELNRLKMLTVSGTSTAPDLSWKGGPFFFRIIPSDGVASEEIAKWALTRGLSRAVVLHDTDDWGAGLAAALTRAYTEGGGQIASSINCPKGFQLFASLAAQVGAARPDVIFLFVYPREAGLFLKQARASNVNAPVMGTDNFTGREMRDLAGPAIEGASYVVPGTTIHGPAYDEFLRRYKTLPGKTGDPSLFELTGYDVATILADVGRRYPNDTEAAIGYLHAHTFGGASGEIAFGKNGDVIVRGYQRVVVTKGADGAFTPVVQVH